MRFLSASKGAYFKGMTPFFFKKLTITPASRPGLNFNFESAIVAKDSRKNMSDINEETQIQSEEQQEQNEQIGSGGAIGFFIFDFLKVFLIAIVIIIPVRWFLFQPFVVTGDSMLPNFQNRNYLIIDELTYRFREPVRGEVVVLRSPNNASDFFIKRIVGLPGERVFINNGHVTVFDSSGGSGLVLEEPYLEKNNITYGNVDRVLGGDEFFVLGDNRLSSSDSRIWGALAEEDIVGRVVVRVLPIKKFQFFEQPVYNFSNP